MTTQIKCRMTDCLHNCGEFCIKQFLVIGKFKTCFGYYKRIDNQEAAKGGIVNPSKDADIDKGPLRMPPRKSLKRRKIK
jgi:hypothetical protein